MKMISFIKGAQKGIHGQVVCVKADVNTTAKCLPRLPTDESLIRVKLKRKLEYKGHHMCQDVNPTKVKQALTWLKDDNVNYEDIDIDFQDFDTLADDQLIHDDHPVNEDNCMQSASELGEIFVDNNIHDPNNHQEYDQHDNKGDFHANVRNDYSHEDIDEDAIEVGLATEVFEIHEQVDNNIVIIKKNTEHAVDLNEDTNNDYDRELVSSDFSSE